MTSSNCAAMFMGFAVCLIFCQMTLAADRLMGGPSKEKDGDASAQAVADAVKSQVMSQLGASQDGQEFVVVKYRTQVVAGTNYFLKIRIGSNEYIHVKVFKPLPHTQQPPEVTGVQSGKQFGDEITSF